MPTRAHHRIRRRGGAAALACAAVLVACGPSTAATVRSGIEGTVVTGPTCPVERPGVRCTRPAEALLVVRIAFGHRVVARVRSARDGRFRIAVKPGRYVLEKGGAGLRVSRPIEITVRPGRFTRVRYVIDSGIR